jgi:hypothetical protein
LFCEFFGFQNALLLTLAANKSSYVCGCQDSILRLFSTGARELSIPCFERGGRACRLAGEAFQRVCRFVSSVKAPASHRSKNAKMLARWKSRTPLATRYLRVLPRFKGVQVHGDAAFGQRRFHVTHRRQAALRKHVNFHETDD